MSVACPSRDSKFSEAKRATGNKIQKAAKIQIRYGVLSLVLCKAAFRTPSNTVLQMPLITPAIIASTIDRREYLAIKESSPNISIHLSFIFLERFSEIWSTKP
jgi:hypothetical protein